MQLCYIYVLHRCLVLCADHLIRGACICGHIIQHSSHSERHVWQQRVRLTSLLSFLALLMTCYINKLQLPCDLNTCRTVPGNLQQAQEKIWQDLELVQQE